MPHYSIYQAIYAIQLEVGCNSDIPFKTLFRFALTEVLKLQQTLQQTKTNFYNIQIWGECRFSFIRGNRKVPGFTKDFGGVVL